MNGGPVIGDEVSLIAEELARAVELTLNPNIAQEARAQAYTACESFKENSPWCAQAGLILASGPQFSPVVQHFGLQLMEHTVKYRWTHIHQAEKLFIKENAMKLLNLGGWETSHLNDALSRVVVEMIKREWPQHWPTMLGELSDACTRGHRHTEIVLHVFLRLVEDVATLQTLEANQRRKDIYQALTSNMSEIFAFFLRLIELHVQGFRDDTASSDFNLANSHGRVVQVVLLTLTGFVEWVSMNHIVTQNGRLLQILCLLLEDEAFQLPAAECLLQIVNRKGSVKERKPLMILFNEEAMCCLHRSIVASMNVTDEKHYSVLKKLMQVLDGAIQQVTSLCSTTEPVGEWIRWLCASCVAGCDHTSIVVCQRATVALLHIARHNILAHNEHHVRALNLYLPALAARLVKVPYPSSRPTTLTPETSTFISLDFDSETEYNSFFNRSRAEFLDLFRQATQIAPLVTWSIVEQWTNVVLNKCVNIPSDADIGVNHPLVAEWDAVSLVLDSVLSRILTCETRPSVTAGLCLLERCITLPIPPPALHTLLLSFVSALFVFLSMASCQLQQGSGASATGAELLPRTLDFIFSSLVAGGGGNCDSGANNPNVTIVKRHAASLMVKLAHKFPLLLASVWPRLHAATMAARRTLSPLESVMPLESLLLVSNHFADYARQAALIDEVMDNAMDQWVQMAPHFSTPETLAKFLGFNEDPSHFQIYLPARKSLQYILTLLQGIVRRCAIPDDPDKAMRGGFSCGTTPSGNPIWRNPCGVRVLPLLPHLLRATHCLAALHTSRTLHPAQRPGQLTRSERAILLQEAGAGQGVDPNFVTEPSEYGAKYVTTLLDIAWASLGCAAAALGRELYAAPGLPTALSTSALAGIRLLPPHRMKYALRAFLKPLLYHCPQAHHADLAVPVMQDVAPFMLEHLSGRWQYITSLYEAGKFEEVNCNESEEVLEDLLNRHITREYLDILKVVLVGGTLTTSNEGNEMEEDGGGGSGGSNRPVELVSECGARILDSTPAVTATLLAALSWPDSVGSLRAGQLLAPALRHLAPQATPDLAARTLAAILTALQVHGEHEANQLALLSLCVCAYDAFRCSHAATLHSVLRHVPGADPNDLQRLHERSANIPPNNKPAKIDKAKRDLFKKIVSGLIGRNVGQLFKKEVFIMDLPTMKTQKEKPLSSILDTQTSTGISNLFAQNTPT